MPDINFGARLVLLRRQLGLSQLEAATLCGLDDGSWSNWERGSSPRNMADVVDKIGEATGCNRQWLMWGRVNSIYNSPPFLHVIPGDGLANSPALFDRDAYTVPRD